MPVFPQKLTEVGAPFCEAEMFEPVWTAPLIASKTVARFHVAAGFKWFRLDAFGGFLHANWRDQRGNQQ